MSTSPTASSPSPAPGAPVRDPLSGRIEAILDLSCLRGDGDTAMLRLVRDAARDIEARLLEQAYTPDGKSIWTEQPLP